MPKTEEGHTKLKSHKRITIVRVLGKPGNQTKKVSSYLVSLLSLSYKELHLDLSRTVFVDQCSQLRPVDKNNTLFGTSISY